MIRVTTDVFCDICGNWVHGVVSDKKEIRWAREIAADQDWIVRWHDGQTIDICPRCQEKEQEAADA
jgi:uncharacterized Zn finger protein (UPF0148 family)